MLRIEKPEKSFYTSKIRKQKKQAKTMVSKREGFVWEVPIKYLRSSHIPPTIRLGVGDGRDGWVGCRFTTPLSTTHTLERKQEKHTLLNARKKFKSGKFPILRM